jgi:ABC-type Fe3+/spermidine/putrescine transport system ATPase subunit
MTAGLESVSGGDIRVGGASVVDRPRHTQVFDAETGESLR